MGCVCVYIQKVELCYWWGYGDEKTRINWRKMSFSSCHKCGTKKKF